MRKQSFLSGCMSAFLLVFILFFVSCQSDDDQLSDVNNLRVLPIEGQVNFRDLGGYQSQNGQYVKWKTIFRSGKCNELTDNDLFYLEKIPLKTVVDFRSDEEQAKEPDKTPESVKSYIRIPIDPGNLGGVNINEMMKNGDVEGAKSYLVIANQSFIRDFQAEYKEFFKILQQEDMSPLVFHCTAGKDRAGLAAALFLSSLGVERKTIIEDYLLTNTCTGITLSSMKTTYGDTPLAECMYYIYSVQTEYIQAAFDVIDEEYGGVERFLTNQLDVDLTRMKTLYLY